MQSFTSLTSCQEFLNDLTEHSYYRTLLFPNILEQPLEEFDD
jgi:hypothetical protein